MEWHKQFSVLCAQVDTADGCLVVSVLRSELLPRTADLLTDTFVDTKGIQPYRYVMSMTDEQSSSLGGYF